MSGLFMLLSSTFSLTAVPGYCISSSSGCNKLFLLLSGLEKFYLYSMKFACIIRKQKVKV